jgi:hypothetical protein
MFHSEHFNHPNMIPEPHTLLALRDMLLPKLLSGELSIGRLYQ